VRDPQEKGWKMNRSLLGVVNCMGKQILESTVYDLEFIPVKVTAHGVIITWEAYHVVPILSLVGAGDDYGRGRYMGD
jgi:hypothetical protein